MAIRSIKILFVFYFPSKTVRLWEGSGPYLDLDGEVWIGVSLAEGGADIVEAAINGEESRITVGVSGVAKALADIAWREVEAGDVVGSEMQILIQDCNEYDDPVGNPEVRWTGTVDNPIFDDTASEQGIRSLVALECVNAFDMRGINAEDVISDTAQKARSAILNPGANPDRVCERMPKLNDKTIQWPRFR
ncbi:hypothetical protein [Mesorhizobium sp. CN2-181]|uniref:hypothetical protein n=1 Tax=Mesorhizobium yinganensis TaxID=3157707 RepID=UPI0032B71233